jgi:hypothetical protein
MPPQRSLAVIPTDLAQPWATKINRSMAESVVAIIQTGRAFLEAKRQLRHGGFQRLFAGHPEAVREPVRCSKRTAERLMKIATHPVLSNATHVSLLPPSWGTLYELTRVEPRRLAEAIDDGVIRPDMTRRQVSALVYRPRVPSPAPPLPAPPHGPLPATVSLPLKPPKKAAAALVKQIGLDEAARFADGLSGAIRAIIARQERSKPEPPYRGLFVQACPASSEAPWLTAAELEHEVLPAGEHGLACNSRGDIGRDFMDPSQWVPGAVRPDEDHSCGLVTWPDAGLETLKRRRFWSR